jgi:hypothetical protein
MSAATVTATLAARPTRSAARARGWMRATAVVLGLFTLGHTLGTVAPRVTRGASEAAVFAAMQGFRFPVMGFTRSYWDFYRGFAITISILQLSLAVVAWQTATLAARDPRAAMPLAGTVLAACLGLTIMSCAFFFGAPIAMAAAASGCAAVALWYLRQT